MNLGIVVFADRAVRVRAGRVEIAQRDPSQAVRALEMRKRPLHGQLGVPVRVDRLRVGSDSTIGTDVGSPYTAQVDENTSRLTPASTIASSSDSDPPTLLW